MAKCRGCGAEIIWCITTSNKRQPFDAMPQRRGIIDFNYDPPAVKMVGTYLPHHASCPEVAQFRKDKKGD